MQYLNKNDIDWVDCWVPKNTKYSRIYKTDLPKIFKNIEHLAKNKIINSENLSESKFSFIEEYKILEKNTALFPNEKMRLHLSDAVQFISRIHNERFDIIFADPPYTMTNFQHLKEKVQSFLKPDGIFCMEMKKEPIEEPNVRVKHYGSTQVVFWKAVA